MSTDQSLLILNISKKLETILSLMKEAEDEAKKLDTSNISLTCGELGCVDGNGHESDNGIREFLIALGELASKKKMTDPLLQPLIDNYTELVDDDTE